MTPLTEINVWMIIGFLLAAFSVVSNDSLQTLGTYISSNRKRTPKTLQMTFVCGVTIFVLFLGWLEFLTATNQLSLVCVFEKDSLWL